MAQYRFTQVDWKSQFILIVPFVLFREMLDNYGWGLAVGSAIVIGVLSGVITDRYFRSVVEFRDSYLFLKKGYSRKTIEIPYTKLEKLTYSNASQFLKLNLYAGSNKMELPPPARLAQAKELFAWLQVKNPAIAFEIIQPKTAVN